MPKISVIMPVFNGARYLKESIESIQNQTFQDWEFIIVNEFGSNDGSSNIIKKYMKADPRIHLVENEVRLGLAASLNYAFDLATGEYIARVDVDDPSYPERFQKQVDFLDQNPQVDLCGTLQRSVTRNSSTIQEVATDAEELKASLLFGCEINHCSVMLRKAVFDKNNWRYDPSYLSEDFELWTRIMDKATFVNLPEALVDHRWGFGNISIEKGESLREEVRLINCRTLEKLGIEVAEKDLILLSGWRNQPIEYAKNHKTSFIKNTYRLLKKIEKRNQERKIFQPEALKKVLYKRWNWACNCCGFSFTDFEEWPQIEKPSEKRKVSVLIPIYNSAAHLRECIDSVIMQTFSDWEIIAVNEFGSNDGSAEIIQAYAWMDPRIHLIQNQEKMGLGESLNIGMRMAQGEYIARLDADDLAHPQRFEKQVELMDSAPNIGVCGTYQHHFGPSANWIHMPPADPKQCKANLLFYCDLCHSTLMLRKELFLENNLFYDPAYLAEDFELWTRAVAYMDIANIPEVLGEYREDGNNITIGKLADLQQESGRITLKSIQNNLHLVIPEEESVLFNGWDNVYSKVTSYQKESMLERFQYWLTRIWEENQSARFYDNYCLLRILYAKWQWAKYDVDWKAKDRWEYSANITCIEQVFDPDFRPPFVLRAKQFLQNNPTAKQKIKCIVRRILRPAYRPIKTRTVDRVCSHIDDMTWNRYQYISKSVESWTWDRYRRISSDMNSKSWKLERQLNHITPLLTSLSYEQNKVPYCSGEKIRLVFLFQIASFWPSMESLYWACKEDARFEPLIVCYDEDIDPTIKTDTARTYLIENGYDFIGWEEFLLDEFQPHAVLLQTPYDYNNRRDRFKSLTLTRKGYRVIYIPYGIEIVDTEHAREAHFEQDVSKYAWRIYVLSEGIRNEYIHYSDNAIAVKAFGLPKFDALYHKDNLSLNPMVHEAAHGRKIVLWKVHFPKVIPEDGQFVLVTPEITEYIQFAKMIDTFHDFFFIFMPHPRFQEFNEDPEVQQQIMDLMEIISEKKNVYIDDHDDYRPSLVNADYIIVDRSAVMIEAAVTGAPILYMTNDNFTEPTTRALLPLVDSYYHGTKCDDMLNFLEMCMEGNDPAKAMRDAAFKECIPFFDGKCGDRIKEDIVQSLQSEQCPSMAESC